MTKYVDTKDIGEGGFGKVTVCERETDKKLFAKKTLLPSADAEGRERFVREVRLLSQLDHPNVVPVVTTRLQTAPLFYVMPLYRTSLADELSSVIGNDTRVHRIFSSILDAIEYAHSEGVIHRDLKPDNILLNNDSEVVVSDFGLGRLVTSDTTRKTSSGPGLGTWQYTAPEQIRDMKRTDHRADILSLGRMLYELFTEPLITAVQDITRLPPAIAVIVERATQARPESRYSSVTEMKAAWLTAIGAVAALSAYDEVRTLVSAVTSNSGSDQKQLQRLLDLVVSNQEDRDLVHGR
jgi:serine/threonine protein kinase